MVIYRLIRGWKIFRYMASGSFVFCPSSFLTRSPNFSSFLDAMSPTFLFKVSGRYWGSVSRVYLNCPLLNAYLADELVSIKHVRQKLSFRIKTYTKHPLIQNPREPRRARLTVSIKNPNPSRIFPEYISSW